MRKTKHTTDSEFVRIKLAFFHRIGAWADALENGDLDSGRRELRHLEVLSERVAQDDLFVKAATKGKTSPEDLVGCIKAYLTAITEAMPYARLNEEVPATSQSQNGADDEAD